MSVISKYAPVWAALKENKCIRVRIPCAPDADLEARQAAFLRFRKALSTRKERDRKYLKANPTARICVDSKDFHQMIFVISLRVYASSFYLEDLSPTDLESLDFEVAAARHKEPDLASDLAALADQDFNNME